MKDISSIQFGTLLVDKQTFVPPQQDPEWEVAQVRNELYFDNMAVISALDDVGLDVVLVGRSTVDESDTDHNTFRLQDKSGAIVYHPPRDFKRGKAELSQLMNNAVRSGVSYLASMWANHQRVAQGLLPSAEKPAHFFLALQGDRDHSILLNGPTRETLVGELNATV